MCAKIAQIKILFMKMRQQRIAVFHPHFSCLGAPGFSSEACTNFVKGIVGRSSITAAFRHAIAYNSV